MTTTNSINDGTESHSQDKYAYGADEVDGCSCPAAAAGFDTHHPALSKLAGRFDERLRDGYKGFDDGTVNPPEVKPRGFLLLRCALQEPRGFP
jgi:hypothetical protein